MGVEDTSTPDERKRQRAYERYQERGGTDGQDIDDWLEAERGQGIDDAPGEEDEGQGETDPGQPIVEDPRRSQ